MINPVKSFLTHGPLNLNLKLNLYSRVNVFSTN